MLTFIGEIIIIKKGVVILDYQISTKNNLPFDYDKDKKKNNLFSGDYSPTANLGRGDIAFSTLSESKFNPRETIRKAFQDAYPSYQYPNLYKGLDSVSDKAISESIPTAKETISKNVEKGALQSDYSKKFPNLESGLAVSYAASLLGKHEVANKAREMAYKEYVPDKPDLTKLSGTTQSSYIPGSHTPLPNPTNQQAPSYQQPSYYPTFSPVSFESSAQNSSLFFKNMTEKDITQYAQSLFTNEANHPELTNYSQSFSSVSSDEPIKDPLKDDFIETKNTEIKNNNFDLGTVGAIADFATLIPAVDTAANIVSLCVDIAEGDVLGAFLSIGGIIPLFGEAADVGKIIRFVDKVGDISKASGLAKNVVKLYKNPKTRKIAKKLGKCVYNGVLTGSVYISDNKSFYKGFANGFASSFVSEYLKFPKMENQKNKKIIKHIEKVLIDSFGSALGNVTEGLMNGDNIQIIIDSVAESAAGDIIASIGSEYVDYTINLAVQADSATRELIDFDENIAEAFKLFFESLITVLNSKEF